MSPQERGGERSVEWWIVGEGLELPCADLPSAVSFIAGLLPDPRGHPTDSAEDQAMTTPTPKHKQLIELALRQTSLLQRRAAFRRWLKDDRLKEPRTRLPGVFYLSDRQWERIAENKVVP